MKNIFIAALLFASAAFAASWDGTKGNITVKTDGDSQHTVISVTSTDSTTSLISVAVTYLPVGATHTETVTKVVSRTIDHECQTSPSLAIFAVDESLVIGVTVIEMHPNQPQLFGPVLILKQACAS